MENTNTKIENFESIKREIFSEHINSQNQPKKTIEQNQITFNKSNNIEYSNNCNNFNQISNRQHQSNHDKYHKNINYYSTKNLNQNKNKFQYFVPWKRADNDPSLVKIGTEIHISPLPSKITHEEIFSFFKSYGEIIDIRIIPRKDKGNCFAFLRFASKESVDQILNSNNSKFAGRNQLNFKGNYITISKSKEETTIFVGNIKKSWSEEKINNILKSRVNFDKLRYIPDPNDSRKNRGYCFLEYENPIIAKEAYDKLSRNIVFEDVSLTIDWADDFSEQDVNKVQIHLSGLKDNISTDELYTIFGQFGVIINIKLARDLEGKGRKDYGFITFSKEEEAERAVKEFKWKDYFDTQINVQFARKMGSIIKHKQKVQGDMLERKRNRDNMVREQKKYKGNSDSDSESDDEERNKNAKQPSIINVQKILIF